MACAEGRERRGGKRLTGKTRGMPPLTALDPSSLAASLSHSFSRPAASFQLMTVAPHSKISRLSPVGSTADTREFLCAKSTCGCGDRPGVEARAVGLLGRSTMAVCLSITILCLAVCAAGDAVEGAEDEDFVQGQKKIIKKWGIGAIAEVDDVDKALGWAGLRAMGGRWSREGMTRPQTARLEGRERYLPTIHGHNTMSGMTMSWK